MSIWSWERHLFLWRQSCKLEKYRGQVQFPRKMPIVNTVVLTGWQSRYWLLFFWEIKPWDWLPHLGQFMSHYLSRFVSMHHQFLYNPFLSMLLYISGKNRQPHQSLDGDYYKVNAILSFTSTTKAWLSTHMLNASLPLQLWFCMRRSTNQYNRVNVVNINGDKWAYQKYIIWSMVHEFPTAPNLVLSWSHRYPWGVFWTW